MAHLKTPVRAGSPAAKPQAPARAPWRTRVGEAVAAYRRDEDGGLILFGLFIFMTMLLAAGMAVDLMHFETTRSKLQSTLDRAILAAADLDQTLDPEGVVRDYFEKAGLSDFLIDVVVDEGLNFRLVSATAESEMPTFFMHMSGVPTLTAPAAGTAQERITEVEISMVLDVSGSMKSNMKIENLKSAADEFLDTIYADPDEENISVSVVPYATQVSAGPRLASEYNITNQHSYSDCVDFPASAFNSSALSTATLLNRTGHFDPFSGYNTDDPFEGYLACPTDSRRDIMPMAQNKNTIKAAIDALQADGNTSIDVGTKWGTALLDPGTRSVVSNLITSGDVSEDFEGRPYDYTEENVLKALIVMTDGINTGQPILASNRSTQLSGIWRWVDPNDSTNIRYSVRAEEPSNQDGDSKSGEDYFHPEYTSWSNDNRWTNSITGGSAAVQLTYQDIWALMPVSTWAFDFYYRQRNNASMYYDARNSVYSFVSDGTKDSRLDAICTSAKNQGIVIFAIGFEVTDHSAGVMQDCASTPSHFFRVEGVEISQAFRSIASTINRLRLTQ